MAILRIYTDGGCQGNQSSENIGGWGAILEYNQHKKELYGGEKNTTNNRMEMTALIKAFEAITKPNQHIEVFSDSGYLMDCFRKQWYIKWIENGWKNSKKEPVENRDLWEQLLPYLDLHRITFYRVKGHVNITHPSTDLKGQFNKFKEWNGAFQTYDMFLHATEMNNRADQLANIGMDEIKKGD